MLTTPPGPKADQQWTPAQTEPACRLCGSRLHRTLIDLGLLPLASRTIAADAPDDPAYPLHVRICDNCTLVQLADTAPPEAITAPLPHLLSRSATGLTQARRQAEAMRKRLRLEANSLVIGVGAKDPTLLGHFQAAGIPVLAIGPAAAAATETAVPTAIGPFNTGTAMEIAVRHGCADLVIATDILPHAPDLFEFVAGLASILRPNGVLVVQVPHLLSLVQKVQFDAFRHNSYTYLSLRVLEHVLRSLGLRVFDAARVPDQGGSLRIQACHVVAPHPARPGLKAVRLAERVADRARGDCYAGFSDEVAAARGDIREFLGTRRTAGRRVAAYGAATRGTTLLGCCGITTEEIPCVADPDPAKHGRLLPGGRIPIVPVQALIADPPDDVVILPWPAAADIAQKLLPLRQRGTQLWALVPRVARV